MRAPTFFISGKDLPTAVRGFAQQSARSPPRVLTRGLHNDKARLPDGRRRGKNAAGLNQAPMGNDRATAATNA